MDFGAAPKPAPIGGPSIIARTDIGATQGGVSVDLPPEKTVQSAKAGDAVRVDVGEREDNRRAERQAQAASAIERQRSAGRTSDAPRERDDGADIESRLVIEQQTKSIVLQRRDRETGETVELVPDEATLKLRIYARQQAEREQAAFEGRFERTA